jgi:isohexenylglutaconyl-CoA hydratase
MQSFEQKKFQTIDISITSQVMTILLNRPSVKNAMNLEMVDELQQVFCSIAEDKDIRGVIIRGAQGNFCSGGDIKDMSKARETIKDDPEAFYRLNRRFGELIADVNACPVVVIAILEGAVLGGGFGLACVSDVAICHSNATFGLPESGLGIPPAQIAAFVVERIGITQTRRLALLGSRFNGNEAYRLGLVHFICEDDDALNNQLANTVSALKRCGPNANRATKQIIQSVGKQPLPELLDKAAKAFSDAIQSQEGIEGTTAFVSKRLPQWAQNDDEE